jgi:hypothetical protein
MTKQLSPAAQHFYDSFWGEGYFEAEELPSRLAAALRAAADQAHPKAHIEDINYVHQNYIDGWKDALYVILAIADELEAQ